MAVSVELAAIFHLREPGALAVPASRRALLALPAAEDHSFIVRIWRESRDVAGAGSAWRGTIEHVGDGRRQHVTELRQIERFIAPYLRQMGVTRGWRDRLGWWRPPEPEGGA